MNQTYSIISASQYEDLQALSELHEEAALLSGDGSGGSGHVVSTMAGHKNLLDMFQEAGFFHGFFTALSVITVSELGDKTFFLAIILAMKFSRLVVFTASMSALAFMTILMSVLGAAMAVIPRAYIHYTSIALFVFFGLKMLKEGYDMSPDEGLDTVESSMAKKDEASSTGADPEAGGAQIAASPEEPLTIRIKQKFRVIVASPFMETFTIIFLAEWGDRSQISTLVLAARENAFAVTVGALVAHALGTGVAVMGGRFVAQRISVKTVTIIGGVVILLFAAYAGFTGPAE